MPSPPPARRGGLRVGVSVVVTVVLGALVVHQVGARQLGEALAGASWPWLAAVIGISLVIHVGIAGAKWWYVLGALGPTIPLREAIWLRLAEGPVRFLLPLKSGEITKAVYLRRAREIPFEVGLASVLVDKATNILVVLAVAVAGLAWMPLGLGPVGLAIGLLAAPFVLSSTLQEACRPLARRAPGRLGRFADDLLGALVGMGGREKVAILALAGILLGAQMLNCAACLAAVGVRPPAAALAFGVPLVVLIANVPVTISGIGLRELGFLYVFAAWGAGERLVAAGLLLSTFGPVLVALVGVPFVGGLVERTVGRGTR